MARKIVVTESDLQRLGSLLEREAQDGTVGHEYLDALKKELDRAKVVPPTEIPPDVITMNSTVRVRDLETDETTEYTLVYPQRANVEENRISIFSPVGTALIGYRVGDVVKWPVPAGTVSLRIEEVLYQPEREGDFDR
jgi:regulator of nucleoside diphosphate kinase